jgi:hypothetical protein
MLKWILESLSWGGLAQGGTGFRRVVEAVEWRSGPCGNRTLRKNSSVILCHHPRPLWVLSPFANSSALSYRPFVGLEWEGRTELPSCPGPHNWFAGGLGGGGPLQKLRYPQEMLLSRFVCALIFLLPFFSSLSSLPLCICYQLFNSKCVPPALVTKCRLITPLLHNVLLFLSEGQTGRAWEPSTQLCPFCLLP